MKLKALAKRYFVIVQPRPVGKKLDVFKCKYCTAEYADHTTRMCKHLLECRGCPEDVKILIKPQTKSHEKQTDKQLVVDATNDGGNVDEVIYENDEPVISSKTSGKIGNFLIDAMTKNDQVQASKLFAKAVYASGTPLSITENPEWLAFFAFIRPGFKVPSRHDISHKLLNEAYDNVKNVVNSKIADAHVVSVQCDAFSNIRNESIINVIMNTPSPVLVRSVQSKTESQNAVYIANLLGESIDEIGPRKVLTAITDNASNCKAAWDIVTHRYSNDLISCYGCSAHILNLYMKDIFKLTSPDAIQKTVVGICKEIKKSHMLLAEFVEIQNSAPKETKCTITLKLPGKTRWGSNIICLESFIRNKISLKLLAISDKSKKLNQEFIRSILSEEMWINIQKLIDFVKPIYIWLRRIESDESRINDMVTLLSDLENQIIDEQTKSGSVFSSEEIGKISKSLKERKAMSLTPIHYAADILDPNRKGKKMNSKDFSTGSDFIIKLHEKLSVKKEEILIEFIEYIMKEGIWGKNYVKKSSKLVKPLEWWKGSCHSSALSKIAIAILQQPCTSAATERSFSTYSWIHSSKRNRLNNIRAGKLIYVAHNTKLLEPKKESVKKLQDYLESSDESDSDSGNEENSEDFSVDERIYPDCSSIFTSINEE